MADSKKVPLNTAWGQRDGMALCTDLVSCRLSGREGIRESGEALKKGWQGWFNVGAVWCSSFSVSRQLKSRLPLLHITGGLRILDYESLAFDLGLSQLALLT